MGWFTKKEQVPELPPAPRLPDLPQQSRISELPTLPSTEFGKNLNQEMVKSAVGSHKDGEEDDFSLPQNHLEEEQMIPSIPLTAHEVPKTEHRRRTIEISEEHKEPITKSIEPIFVKITDFQKAQKDFREIAKKVNQTEKILAKIKDTKTKEDEQIEKWIQEIEKTKTKLSEIDSEIFSKI